MPSFLYVVVIVYWAVLVAELIGDKTVYTVLSLSLRVRGSVILSALALSSAFKMAIIVSLGSAIAQIQGKTVAMISAGAFFASAVMVALKREKADSTTVGVHWQRSAAACFMSLFLSEWADPGQIVAAASTIRVHLPVAVWLGATLAMTTKGLLALLLGLRLRDRIPRRLLRPVAAVSLSILGLVALTQIALGR